MTDNSSASAATNGSDCVENETLRIPLAVTYSVIFVVGLVGNLFALWVFFFIHSKKNSLRLFLINLAFADLLLMFCLPFRIHYHTVGNKWELNPILCKAVGYFLYMNMYISITLLGLISIDRYMKIYGSAGIRRKMQSTKWSYIVCAIIWIVAFVLLLPFVIVKNIPDPHLCFHYRKVKDLWKANINIFLLVVFWLVFFSLMISYGKIALKLLKRSQEQSDLPTAPHYAKTAKKSFFILFLFIICFVPYHMFRALYIKTQISDMSCFWQNFADKANEISLVFSALNSCLDPVMFFLLSSSVRREVQRFMNSVLCVGKTPEVIGTSSNGEMDSKTDDGQLNLTMTSNVKESEFVK